MGVVEHEKQPDGNLTGIAIVQADLAEPADRADVVSLVDHFARDDNGQGRALDQDVQQRLDEALASHDGLYAWLARRGPDAIGLALCVMGYSSFNARPSLELHDLVVVAAFRGQGIGKSLIESVSTCARALGCCRVTLGVNEQNPKAHQLYRALGFSDCDATGKTISMQLDL